LHRVDEYKDKIHWDIWEDIMTNDRGLHVPKGNAEEYSHENPNIPIFTHILKRYKKT